MAVTLIRVLNALFSVYSLAIVFRALLPWLRIDPYHPVMRFLVQITEPLLAPLRRLVPAVGGLDFTPMVALIILWAVEQFLRVLLTVLL
ncbi:MAG: YggT family protein [Anaerolineales bacterium]|nr:YggT family protein [Anaerolineales bacterium]